MITRDSKASISGTAQSARQRLGEIIKFYADDRGHDNRSLSRRAKVGIPVVESWIAGKVVPSRDEWKALCHGINRALHNFTDVYERAREEADTEARDRAARNTKEQPKPMRADTKINTALADKLVAIKPDRVIVDDPEPIPPPPLRVVADPKPTASQDLGLPVRGTARDGRAMPPERPPGADKPDARELRRRYVRELLIANPNKRTSGADSVIEHVRKRFGIGISPETVDAIREDLKVERIKAEVLAGLPAPVPATKPAMAAQLLADIATPIIDNKVGNSPPSDAQQAYLDSMAATPEPAPSDLEAAVQLIREALPGLQSFTITVDEHGEASVDWQIRKVKVETVGGSIKVKR